MTAMQCLLKFLTSRGEQSGYPDCAENKDMVDRVNPHSRSRRRPQETSQKERRTESRDAKRLTLRRQRKHEQHWSDIQYSWGDSGRKQKISGKDPDDHRIGDLDEPRVCPCWSIHQKERRRVSSDHLLFPLFLSI